VPVRGRHESVQVRDFSDRAVSHESQAFTVEQ
jgi:hypothetical protein